MAQNIKKGIVAMLALALLLAGCKSKMAMQSQEETTTDNTIVIAGLQAVTPDTVALQHLSGNANINIKVSGSNISLKGKLRVKRGDGVQISITPLGLIEAACIAFLTQEIRFIN